MIELIKNLMYPIYYIKMKIRLKRLIHENKNKSIHMTHFEQLVHIQRDSL